MQNRIQITTNDVITPMPMTAHVGRPDSSLIIFIISPYYVIVKIVQKSHVEVIVCSI